jgi:NAD(P)-dependent dehydrogenase (short-subunit alcohol dehydrogenase family)
MSDLAGRHIIIVGGSTGIGLSGAKCLHNQGASLMLLGRSQENLENAKVLLGERVDILAGDATDPALVDQAIRLSDEKGQPLYGLLHVAGGSGRKMGDGPLHELSDDGLNFTLDLNLKSVIYSNRSAVRAFLRQGTGGVILNTSSVLGYSPSPRFFGTHAYAAAKAGIIGFTQSIAAYYAEEGIRANILAPGLVETPMAERACQNPRILEYIRTKQPLDGGRVGRPEDLEAAIGFFLSDASRFITGQILAVDGGWSVSEGQNPDEMDD